MKLWTENRRKLKELLQENDADALVLTSASNITYATGIRDPTGMLVLSEKCGDSIITPLLDYYRIHSMTPGDIEVYAFYRGGEEGVEADIPPKKLIKGSPVEALSKTLDQCNGKILADLGYANYGLGRTLVEKLGVEDATQRISRVRMVKSDSEVQLIQEAARLAEEALRRAVDALGEGVSEAEIASIIYSTIVNNGGWGLAFPTIVAFYSNTAYPHHTPGMDGLSVEGPVLIDWGAIYSGYRSDTTRTLWWGSNPSKQFKTHLESVEEAVEAALDVLAPGVVAGDVDNAARTVLRKRGLAKYFIHGLGHGVGVDIHEEPYLRPASTTVLEPGMIVTIEPGVYLPGLYGIRIEDLVLITKTGFKHLVRLPHIIA